MKQTLRILALITALLLTLPLFGCLVPKDAETQTDAQPTGDVKAPEGLDNGETPDVAIDEDAVAIELGDIQIKVGEFEEMYDQYVSMFYYYGLDADSLTELLSMTEEWLIEYYLPEWKAKELGVTLSAEDEAEIAAAADSSLEEERNEILLMFAEEFLEEDEIVEDASQLSDLQYAAVLDAINEELSYMFEDGYTFEQYLEMRRENYLSSLRADKLAEILENDVRAAAAADQSAIDEQYETQLSAQKTTFDENAKVYLDLVNGTGVTDFALPLYVPTEAARLEIIRIRENEEPDETLEAKKDAMKALEAEYGALALNGENEERQAEIIAEYAVLREELETEEASSVRAARNAIDSAYADLIGGMSFEEAMNAYNETDENGSGRTELIVLLGAADPYNPELAEAAAALEEGAYSEAFQIGSEYYIVRLAEKIPQGVVDRASIADALLDSVLHGAIGDEIWGEQYDAWLEEAMSAAVYHRETYDMLPDLYLDYVS